MNRPHRPFARLCASLSLLVACSSPGGGGTKASVADGDRATKLQTVRAKLAGQDYDAALLITDELIKRYNAANPAAGSPAPAPKK